MQFEIEEKESYYKTYTDRLFYGNFFTQKKELIGSIVSGSIEYTKAQNAYEFYFKKNNRKFRSGTNRFLTLNEEDVYYYDSFLPEFTDIYKQNGGKFVRAYGDEVVAALLSIPYLYSPLKLLIGNYFCSSDNLTVGVFNIQATDGQFLADVKWSSQYPFEYQFKNISRVEMFKTEKVSSIYSENAVVMSASIGVEYGTTDAIYNNRYRIAFHQGSNTINPGAANSSNYLIYSTTDSTGSVNLISNSFTNTNLKELSDAEIRIGFYGIDISESAILSTGTFVNFSYFNLFGLTTRGWKYGIYNGFPTKPKAIFRRNRYGMFSDKLENRLFSLILNKKTNTFYRPIDAIEFISGTNDFISASNYLLNTRESGIYDYFYVSRKPFAEI
jgi:hypothetical protein